MLRRDFVAEILSEGGLNLSKGEMLQKIYTTLASALSMHIPHAMELYTATLLQRSGKRQAIAKSEMKKKMKT